MVLLVDAISYIAVIASLLVMRARRAQRAHARRRACSKSCAPGCDYVAGFAPVRALLLLRGAGRADGMPYTVLMPVIASKVLHGGPHTLGILMTASGVGALAGTLYLASRQTVIGLGKVIVAASLGLSLGLIAFSFSRVLWLSMIVLPLVGAGMMVQAAASNTILQTVVDEHLRGRVMAFYSVAIMGMQPIGALLAGYLAERIGTTNTIFYGALACLAGAILIGIRRPMLAEHVRPIYIERGILVDPTTQEAR